MEILDFKDSNKAQQYSTHPMFRYFGKLPPTLVARLVKEYCYDDCRVLELMCGSGTTMVEAKLHGYEADGIDINPLSVLISNVKCTPISESAIDESVSEFERFISDAPTEAFEYFRPVTRNLNNWFTLNAQRELSATRYFIDEGHSWSNDRQGVALKDFFVVSLASIVRKVSNASERTGRIFRCSEDCTLSPYEELLKKLATNKLAIQTLPADGPTCRAVVGDARSTPFQSDRYGFVLNHPPYFALYKYSSDVMRFELEWLGFNRRKIAKGEIEDGFKTSNASLVEKYIADMADVFKEMHRVLKPGGIACVVVSDSTLREEQLPVIDGLIPRAEACGLILLSHKLRPVSYTQASYHRSANPRIKTNEDHVLVFSK